MNENITNIARAIATKPRVNFRFLKNSSGSNGYSVLFCHCTNPNPVTMAIANAARTSVSVQPRLGPSIIPNSNDASAMTERIAPIISRGLFSLSLDFGTIKAPTINANMIIGTLIKNTISQSYVSTAQPPTSKPIGAPTPAIAAHIPIALPRSSGGNTTNTTDRVEGMTNAAPRPIVALARITSVDESAYNAVQADAAPTIINPICNAPLRPNLSPNAPITRRVPPKTRA